MDKKGLIGKLDKFCPDWMERADPSLPIDEIFQRTISQVLPGLLKLQIEHLDDDKIIGIVPYLHETSNVLGYMHGGTIFTAGDTLAGTFIWAKCESNQFAVTTGAEIKYLRPIKTGHLKCTVTEKSRLQRKVILEALFEDSEAQNVGVMTVEYLLVTKD